MWFGLTLGLDQKSTEKTEKLIICNKSVSEITFEILTLIPCYEDLFSIPGYESLFSVDVNKIRIRYLWECTWKTKKLQEFKCFTEF